MVRRAEKDCLMLEWLQRMAARDKLAVKRNFLLPALKSIKPITRAR
jgi:hypothetical protein